jgi:hypothetical protein
VEWRYSLHPLKQQHQSLVRLRLLVCWDWDLVVAFCSLVQFSLGEYELLRQVQQAKSGFWYSIDRALEWVWCLPESWTVWVLDAAGAAVLYAGSAQSCCKATYEVVACPVVLLLSVRRL